MPSYLDEAFPACTLWLFLCTRSKTTRRFITRSNRTHPQRKLASLALAHRCSTTHRVCSEQYLLSSSGSCNGHGPASPPPEEHLRDGDSTHSAHCSAKSQDWLGRFGSRKNLSTVAPPRTALSRRSSPRPDLVLSTTSLLAARCKRRNWRRVGHMTTANPCRIILGRNRGPPPWFGVEMGGPPFTSREAQTPGRNRTAGIEKRGTHRHSSALALWSTRQVQSVVF